MSQSMNAGKAALRRAAETLGGQAAIAALLEYDDRRNVWPWFNTDRPIPEEHCPAIERATFDAGEPVTCEEMRPDITWHRVADKSWPWHRKGRPTIDVTRTVPEAG